MLRAIPSGLLAPECEQLRVDDVAAAHHHHHGPGPGQPSQHGGQVPAVQGGQHRAAGNLKHHAFVSIELGTNPAFMTIMIENHPYLHQHPVVVSEPHTGCLGLLVCHLQRDDALRLRGERVTRL